MFIRQGSAVNVGDTLYRLESKEQHALGNGNASVSITSGCDGIILDVSAQKGAFAPEGSALCTIAGTEGLVFEINVPYGYRNLAQPGSSCLLELPDGTLLKAKVHSMLATMNTVSQTAKVIAKADAPFLPEGMNIKATFTSVDASATTTVLPRNAVQSDEYMSEHWIMKLAEDSTAVKVPVKTGYSNADSIEIIYPPFPPGILSSALADTDWKTGQK